MRNKSQKFYRSNSEMVVSFLDNAFHYFVLGVIAALVTSFADMITPQIIRFTIDNVVGEEKQITSTFMSLFSKVMGGIDYFRKNLWVLAIAIIVVAAVKVTGQYLFRVWNSKGAETFIKNMRDRIYAHLQRLPFEWHMKTMTGDIIQRCTTDIEMIKSFVSEQMTSIFRIILLLVTSMYFMFKMNWQLSIVAIIPMPIIIANSFRYFRQVTHRFRECDENEGKLSAICQENLTGIRVVRAFGREDHEFKKFEGQNAHYTGLWDKMAKIMSRFWSVSDFLSGTQIMLVVIVGAYLCVKNGMTSGAYVAFISYNYKLVWPIRQLGRMLSEMSKAGVSIDRVKEIVNEPEEDLESGDWMDHVKGEIQFDHVTFGYEEGKDIVKDVTFTAPAGTTLGIIGGVGSGKSTLMLLLDKLYGLKEGNGSISIDGKNINDWNTTSLRQNIGYVLQEPFLFSRTLKDNIGIAMDNPDLEQIRDAASSACLDEAIEGFAKGYDTFVGERGVTLSGGQKQRAAIARMLAQNTPIMIFDDSLSAVDAETDAKIRAELEKRFGKATIILISHRINTISKADQILVLDQGSIVERGTHQELIHAGGLYQKIYEIQSGVEDLVLNE